jgi:hypothetical protein
MSNKKGLFGILNDGAGAGVGVDKANPDTTLGSAINSTIATPCFINSSGVLVFPQLEADGSIKVSLSNTSGACYSNHNKITGGTNFANVAVQGLSNNTVYDHIGFIAASMTECDWELVFIYNYGTTNDEIMLARFDTGPGQYTVCCDNECLTQDTTGYAGNKVIALRGKLLEATGSEIMATITVHQN